MIPGCERARRGQIPRVALILMLIGGGLVLGACASDTKPVAELGTSHSEWIEIDDTLLHYTLTGSGEPSVVALHGFGAHTFTWRHLCKDEALPGTFVAYDRPGFGLTERPSKPAIYDPARAPDHLFALMDQVGMEKAILIAHSAGARVALQAARQHPERISALVLVAPAVGGGRARPMWLCSLLRLPGIHHAGRLAMRLTPRFLAHGLASSWSDPEALPPKVLEGYRLPLRAANWDLGLWYVLLAGICAESPTEPTGNLPTSLPILVITGDLDRIIPPGSSRNLALELGARFRAVPGTAHLPHEEDPHAFRAILLEFLEDEGLAESGGE